MLSGLCRIYAENPNAGFLPGSGRLEHLRSPEEVVGRVRVDTGVRQGPHCASTFASHARVVNAVVGAGRR